MGHWTKITLKIDTDRNTNEYKQMMKTSMNYKNQNLFSLSNNDDGIYCQKIQDYSKLEIKFTTKSGKFLEQLKQFAVNNPKIIAHGRYNLDPYIGGGGFYSIKNGDLEVYYHQYDGYNQSNILGQYQTLQINGYVIQYIKCINAINDDINDYKFYLDVYKMPNNVYGKYETFISNNFGQIQKQIDRISKISGRQDINKKKQSEKDTANLEW